jgi:hypothetical protein
MGELTFKGTPRHFAGKRVVIKDAGPKERALAVVPIPTERSVAAGNTRSAIQSAPFNRRRRARVADRAGAAQSRCRSVTLPAQRGVA